MSIEFRMPSLGPDMEAGTLAEWRVKPGESIKRGDVIALVETDKGVIDVEVFADAVVERLLVEPGVKVPVGAVLAQLSAEAAQVEPVTASVGATPQEVSGVAASPPSPVPSAAPHRVKISPAARAKARALGIDPATLTGSAPGGVITLEDVEKRHAAPERADTARDVIARAMSKSKREVPHFYLSTTCSFANARVWLDRYNANASIEKRLLPPALFVKAVAAAARAEGGFNGFYTERGFQPAADVNVGMAIAMRGGGLVAPAILAADTKDVATVMAELKDLTTRVRAGHMRATELSLPTITVTSLGEEGIDAMTPVIYPPQVAIVAFGSIVERPWVVEATVRPAPVVNITLAADHRVNDGRSAARFLRHIVDALQAPDGL